VDIPGPVLFDCGVPDVARYLCPCGLPVPGHVTHAAAEVTWFWCNFRSWLTAVRQLQRRLYNNMDHRARAACGVPYAFNALFWSLDPRHEDRLKVAAF
jgi:hypothetical protein